MKMWHQRQQCASLSSSRTVRQSRSVVAAAKNAKKEKKGSAQKKPGGALADLLKRKEETNRSPEQANGFDGFARPDQYKHPDVLLQLLMICQSYWKHTGEYLMETSFENLANAMYRAPFACLAHNMFEEGVTEVVYTYANRAALDMFEATWDDLVGLPSTKTTMPELRQERQNRPDIVAQQGSVVGEAMRCTLKGNKRKLLGATLFNVAEPSGELWGQAIVVRQYELEDATLVQVTGETPPPEQLPPGEEDVAAAEAAVAQQAEVVRGLKEGRGLNNQDEEVQEAVLELKARKQRLAEVKQAYQEALAGAAADDEDYDESKLFDDEDDA